MKWAILIIPILLLAVLVAGCTQPQPPTQPPGGENQTPLSPPIAIASISIKNFAFSPSELVIKMGTTVKWTNEDSAPHTVKFNDFQSGQLPQGGTYEHQFNTAGTFEYTCGIHPSMKGKVVVE
jgi:plastocyanin